MVNKISRIIDIITAIIGVTLGIRVLLQALGANASTPFVRWIYVNMTDSLLIPFNGIFPMLSLGPRSVVNIPAIVAMIIYVIAGYGISTAIESVASDVKVGSMFRIGQKKPKEQAHSTMQQHTPVQPHNQNMVPQPPVQQPSPQPQMSQPAPTPPQPHIDSNPMSSQQPTTPQYPSQQ